MKINDKRSQCNFVNYQETTFDIDKTRVFKHNHLFIDKPFLYILIIL